MGSLRRIFYYPSYLPQQIGWIALIPAVLGLAGSFRGSRRAAMWPYLAIILSVYVIFTAISERESRHSIFWIPAWSVLAIEGIDLALRWTHSRMLWYATTAAVCGGALITSLMQPRLYVRGYDQAAKFVLDNLGDSRVCFFDGYLDGNFIYQLRRQDPQRRLWVLRGDKLLYSVVSGDRAAGYAEYARTDEDILKTLSRYGPGLIVVESRSAAPDFEVANRLRVVLRGHPERFQLLSELPIHTTVRRMIGTNLQVFKNLVRDPAAPKRLEFEMQPLGRSIGTTLPEGGAPIP
jgi:hypothetical protein